MNGRKNAKQYKNNAVTLTKQHNFLNFLDIKIKLNTIMYTPADRV